MKRMIATMILLTALAFCACAKTDAPENTPEPTEITIETPSENPTEAPVETKAPDPAEALIGSWKLDTEATIDGLSDDERPEFVAAVDHGLDMAFYFGADRAGSMTVKNGSQTTVTDFKYKVESGLIVMEPESGERDIRTFEIADGRLYLWKSGSALVFVRA